jgi:Ca2+ transporting ATPase
MHFTLFFNVFVYLQVFNFLNARKLKRDDVNIFHDMFSNALFVSIVVGIFVLQLFIVQMGGKVFHLSPLSIEQHLICIAIGSLSIVNGVFVKTMIPESWLNRNKLFHIDEERERPYDVDRYINKILGGPSTMLRKSQNKRELLRERVRRSEAEHK